MLLIIFIIHFVGRSVKPGYTAWFIWEGTDYPNIIKILYCFKKDGDESQYNCSDEIPDFPEEDDDEEMETAGGEPLDVDIYNADGGKSQGVQFQHKNAMLVA